MFEDRLALEAMISLSTGLYDQLSCLFCGGLSVNQVAYEFSP